MNVLEHTTNWYKGEIFEAIIMGIIGIVLIIISLVFWKLGKTPNTQAILIPLLVVGVLLSVAGSYGAFNNNEKMKLLHESEIKNHEEFTLTEKQRVENFQSLYTYTKIGAALFFALAILLFFSTENRHWQAVAIALIVTGLSGLVIDYFSKERATIYYNELLKITG